MTTHPVQHYPIITHRQMSVRTLKSLLPFYVLSQVGSETSKFDALGLDWFRQLVRGCWSPA